MKTTMSLKQLRTDPREYIRLLNSGYEVAITEHRKTIASAVKAETSSGGNIHSVLEALANLPEIETPYPETDTVTLIRDTRTRTYEQKLATITEDDRPRH